MSTSLAQSLKKLVKSRTWLNDVCWLFHCPFDSVKLNHWISWFHKFILPNGNLSVWDYWSMGPYLLDAKLNGFWVRCYWWWWIGYVSWYLGSWECLWIHYLLNRQHHFIPILYNNLRLTSGLIISWLYLVLLSCFDDIILLTFLLLKLKVFITKDLAWVIYTFFSLKYCSVFLAQKLLRLPDTAPPIYEKESV